jgi:hypothetical protein
MALYCHGCEKGYSSIPIEADDGLVILEHDVERCVEGRRAAEAAWAARPNCIVEGCKFPYKVRVDRWREREALFGGARALPTGRAWLLCQRHADGHHDLDETVDGRVLDIRMVRR